MADTSAAAKVIHNYVTPIIGTMAVLASLVCVFFLVVGGYHYMTSSGKPERLEHAKLVLRNALIGLVIVLGAATLTAILSHTYASTGAAMTQKLPNLTTVTPKPVSNGLVEVIIKAVTGLLNNIIQSAASPILKALSFFTSSTPLMAANSGVFNLWLAIVGITDALFVLVVALLGFHVMGYATFGLDEIEFKHLLPQIGLIFLLVNSSLFIIDGIISLSNALIHAIAVGFGNVTVWDVLTKVVNNAGGLGLATLLIMIAFVVLSIILLVYYVGRIVTLYIGAVLSPLALLLWLIPSFRDFSESAAKVYLTTIFVLFIHVVILQLAASLFSGLVVNSPTHTPDTLMAMVVGLATLIALLKTQGVLMQLSYVAAGPKTARKLGGQFINGVSYFGGKGKAVVATVYNRQAQRNNPDSGSSKGNKTVIHTTNNYAAPSPQSSKPKTPTGTTTVAPKASKPKVMEKP